jgi:uncharacterized protein
MGRFPRYTIDLLAGSATCLALLYLSWRTWKATTGKQRWLLLAMAALATVFIVATVATTPHRFGRLVPNTFYVWLRAGGLLAFAWVWMVLLLRILWDRIPAKTDPKRRQLLQNASLAVPAALTGIAFINHERLHLSTQRITIPNLPKDLQGLRIVLLSDLHLSPIVPERLIARAIDLANETKPHLAAIGGDLISRAGDPLDQCIRQIARLKADAGVLGCLGNHEIYCGCEDYVSAEAARQGVSFLRQTNQVLRFGDSRINVAGVDFQSFRRPYLVGAEALRVDGMPNVLLSHNPDVFPVAAQKGFDLTLSGHTHGGQVNFEILNQNVNVARFFTPFVMGDYQIGEASLYVTRGVGSIGLPVRMNALPEVSLIELCATS